MTTFIENSEDVTMSLVKRLVDQEVTFVTVGNVNDDPLLQGLQLLLLAGVGSLDEIIINEPVPLSLERDIENMITYVCHKDFMRNYPYTDKLNIEAYQSAAGRPIRPLIWYYSRILNGIYRVKGAPKAINIKTLASGLATSLNAHIPRMIDTTLDRVFQNATERQERYVTFEVERFDSQAVGEYVSLWIHIFITARHAYEQWGSFSGIRIRKMDLFTRFIDQNTIAAEEENFRLLMESILNVLDSDKPVIWQRPVFHTTASGLRIWKLDMTEPESEEMDVGRTLAKTKVDFQGFEPPIQDIDIPDDYLFALQVTGRDSSIKNHENRGVYIWWMQSGRITIDDIDLPLTSRIDVGLVNFEVDTKRYRLLGQGSYGKVYLDKTDQTVHKVFLTDKTNMWFYQQSVMNELFINSYLVHKSKTQASNLPDQVLRPHHLYAIHNDHMITMAMPVALCSLYDFVTGSKGIYSMYFKEEAATRYHIIRQLASAMAYLQLPSVGVVHNDIKPHNFLIVRDGLSLEFTVKINDFGLAVIPRIDELYENPSLLAKRIGYDMDDVQTQQYRSPEAAMHIVDSHPAIVVEKKEADRCLYAADMWAIAVTMIEVMGGFQNIVYGASYLKIATDNWSNETKHIADLFCFSGKMDKETFSTRYDIATSNCPDANGVVLQNKLVTLYRSIGVSVDASQSQLTPELDRYVPNRPANNLVDLMLSYDWTSRPLASELMEVLGSPLSSMPAIIPKIGDILLTPRLLQLKTQRAEKRMQEHQLVAQVEADKAALLEALKTPSIDEDKEVSRRAQSEFSRVYGAMHLRPRASVKPAIEKKRGRKGRPKKALPAAKSDSPPVLPPLFPPPSPKDEMELILLAADEDWEEMDFDLNLSDVEPLLEKVAQKKS